MALPEHFLQELKMRTDIADLVSSYVNLKRIGKRLVGLCPFHNEKTPSFNVSSENQFFYCFGCSTGGDIITFVMKIENLDYIEAVKLLANRAGMQMPEDGYDNSAALIKTTVLEINRETARFYHQCLMDDEEGMSYFKSRQLDMRTIKHFGLGYAPKDRFSLVNHLKKLGYKNDDMVLANVAFLSKNGNPVDRFHARVMFPIIDLRGNVIAFGGRILTDEKPKYINTSDTPVYHKSTGLFAMNFAKNSKQSLILAEGYMDVIALHQAGFTGAIASLGTALTAEQARIIAKYTKEVIICYDSDEAGQKATQRAIPILRQTGISVRVLTIPNGKDPDGFIKSHGKDGAIMFKALLEGSGNDLEYQMEKIKLTCDMESSAGKVEYLKQCCILLAKLDNAIERDIYSSKVASEISVEKSSIMQQINKLMKNNSYYQEKEREKKIRKELSGVGDRINPDKPKNLKIANAEEALIAYMLSHPDGVDYCKLNIKPDDFATGFGKRVFNIILGKTTENNTVNLTDLSGDLSSEELSSLSRILIKFSDVNLSRSDAKDYISLIKKEGKFSDTKSIKNAEKQELADYIESLRNKKK